MFHVYVLYKSTLTLTLTRSFQQHNLVTVQFMCSRFFYSEWDIMLCEVLSEFPQFILPL